MAIPVTLKIPVTLQDGQTLIVTALSQRDMLSVVKEAKRERFASIIRSIPPECSDEEKRSMQAIAMRDIGNIDVKSDSIWSDIDLINYILYLSLRKEQQSISMRDVVKITDVDGNLELLLGALNAKDKEENIEEEKKKE